MKCAEVALLANTPSEAKGGCAFIVASNVLGGHEYQSAALASHYAKIAPVTIFLNQEVLAPAFSRIPNATVIVNPGAYISRGTLPRQVLKGAVGKRHLVRQLSGFGEIVVCAGAIEAAIPSAIALRGHPCLNLYLPFLYDRRVLWGAWGCVYNLLAFPWINLFRSIITINRIQATLMRRWVWGDTKVRVHRNSVLPLDRLPVTDVAPRLVCIGRLDRQKRVPELIRAVDSPAHGFKELLIIGDGPKRDEVRRAASAARFIKVDLLGWVPTEQQSRRLNGQDILVLNSAIEGEPLVLREARERGMRVLAADIPGVRGVTKPSERYGSKAALLGKLAGLRCSSYS